jgi:sulfatase modifying factor 1
VGHGWDDPNWDDGYADTAPVDAFPLDISPYGVIGMAGNVTEWVSDAEDFHYYERSPEVNPQGPVPSEGSSWVTRGGSWRMDALGTRTGARYGTGQPDEMYGSLGIRCVRSVTPRAEPTP